ncbi:NAD-dependent deacylase sirtuin-mitochondrial-like [Micractinium conductrix]|uniref:NAD-dependent protein deacylase n=1 Tax=Micractinium conductrix TaxID=554055 RepID=A0A2P6V610_9CHLO|nr:NAD-dependent deacylase sirtuin-mitochondrial-like [Micractinium conductrix]|eukprot:PSC69521.1 NAD-dependent deacylase sirtuin-mitochondrial-like [Micractinium conductrix]
MSLAQFQAALAAAKSVVVLTGAGVSAESGIPTFRGADGLWRNFDPGELATQQAFLRRPSLVWEFYSWRREVAAACRPNCAHHAIAALERRLAARHASFTLVTQNVDRLHQEAGSNNVVELHGSIWDVCVAGRGARKAGPCWEDRCQPLAPSLAGRGAPDGDASPAADLPLEQLPRDASGRLLRPGVVWFGEALDPAVLKAAEEATASCDLFITAGTSAVVYPAAGFAEAAAERGAAVAEFNLEPTPATDLCHWQFRGKAGDLLPAAFRVEAEVAGAMQAQLQQQATMQSG